MNWAKYIFLKLCYWYYCLILQFKYKIKPNNNGTFDLKICPSFKNAKLTYIKN